MTRDVRKALEEYRALKERKGERFGVFRYSDLCQVKEIGGGSRFETISAALEFGFIVGYKAAKRERRNNGKD